MKPLFTFLIILIFCISLCAYKYFVPVEKESGGNLILNNSQIKKMSGNKIYGKIIIDGVEQ